MARVECARCHAHRDLERAPRCLVCGAVMSTVVSPNAADVDAITKELIAAGEAVDLEVIQRGAVVGVAHPALQRLREACRRMALARAGRLEG